MKKKCCVVLLSLALPLLAAGPRTYKPGSPLEHLPNNIELVSEFGERPDFSPDNKSLAFMGKSFGDAFVMDLATRRIRCLTCDILGAAFLRVMHLASGDYLLVGPERLDPANPSRGRTVDNELWFLSRTPGSRPVKLGVKLFEGIAISKKAMKLGWSQNSNHDASIPKDHTRMFVGEIEVKGATAKLVNARQVLDVAYPPCRAEPQDFFDSDKRMTSACYSTAAGNEERSEVMVLDFATGKYEDYSQARGAFSEPEGIFPGGQYTLVESDRHARVNGVKVGPGWQIDLYKMKLDGTGKDIVRLTHFNDHENYTAFNPVVSTDGKFMAFSIGRSTQVGAITGAGHGILLYHLN